MATTHIISTSNNMSGVNTGSGTPTAGSSSNVVGVHYKVGKKIGEGSFGVIFEGEYARFWVIDPAALMAKPLSLCFS
jgi:hypothetical protein